MNIHEHQAKKILKNYGAEVPKGIFAFTVQDLLKKYDILLIVDEVICGFGRTGNWFGSDTYNIQPDIITMAKGITSGYVPLSGIMIGKRVSDVIINVPRVFSEFSIFTSSLLFLLFYRIENRNYLHQLFL